MIVLRLLVVVVLFVRVGVAQVTKHVTTVSHEPGIYDLSELFEKSDRVVLVKVIAGDTEAYDVAIYKAEVKNAFKGAKTGETIYFGPFLGERLGREYVLFLRDVPKPITPKPASSTGYGTIRYSEVFNEGYTSMETSYECVFDGRDIAQTCDYGVRVCTDYIKLPKSIPAFSPEGNDPPFGCRWARKSLFASFLSGLTGSMK